MVTVRLFASLKDLAGTEQVKLSLPQDPATVDTVFEELTARFPAMREYRTSLLAAVNREYASWEKEVRAGDEVAFFPPVSGGAS